MQGKEFKGKGHIKFELEFDLKLKKKKSKVYSTCFLDFRRTPPPPLINNPYSQCLV